MEELWSKAESLLGPVHCLVNNAGVTIIKIIISIKMKIFFVTKMICSGDGGEGGLETDP